MPHQRFQALISSIGKEAEDVCGGQNLIFRLAVVVSKYGTVKLSNLSMMTGDRRKRNPLPIWHRIRHLQIENVCIRNDKCYSKKKIENYFGKYFTLYQTTKFWM